MSKVTTMDCYLVSQGKAIDSSDVCEAVKKVFEIDLEQAPILHIPETIDLHPNNELTVKVVLDAYINHAKEAITGEGIRQFINDIFGVNLNAISALDEARISIYSKNQWIVQNEQDLFIVHTSNKDVDVEILPTNYFKEQTKLEGIPNNLQRLLRKLGYQYDRNEGSCKYSNPSGIPVADKFKGQTMEVVKKVIQESYFNI